MSELDIPRRYELKYAIPESQVEAVRDALRPYCALDPYCAATGDHSYDIETIYFDTWARELYRRCRERRPISMKVRARAYGDGGSPVFLEVKRKEHDLIRKTRARISSGWVERLREPAPADASPEEVLFRDHLARFSLQPALLVRYRREAWLSTVDGYARATFDRRITCQPWSRWEFDGGEAGWLALDGRRSMFSVPRGVVLELKCTLDVPRWMSALVRRLGLQRIGYSKYCNGVERVWGRAALADLVPCSA